MGRQKGEHSMGFDLDIFKDSELHGDYIAWLVEEQSVNIQRHFTRLWEYYSNPMFDSGSAGVAGGKVGMSGRCYLQAQEYGLPARITGVVHSAGSGIFGAKAVKDVQRKEVVIENDIAWRLNVAVDFLFGKPFSIVSKSPDSQKRAEIELILKAVFAANGGIGFFQDMAVLGGVYGFVDCLVRPGERITDLGSPYGEHFNSSSSQTLSLEGVLQLAERIGPR